MTRRTWIKLTTLASTFLLTGLKAFSQISILAFPKRFIWGVAISAFQNEGAVALDGKSFSIWDVFTRKKGKIHNHENANTTCDFYHQYKQDVDLVSDLNFNAFRFSLAWTRILSDGTGQVNTKGIDFYNRLIDACLEKGIAPWVTLYHWDLPQILEDKGGWTNRSILDWFSNYVDVCTKAFGDRVKNWMVLNEPMSYTGLGYFAGYHAPGRKGVKNFLSAAHHTALCNALGGKIIRNNVNKAYVGTTFSTSYVEPKTEQARHVKAAERMNAVLNWFYIDPVAGKGYPYNEVPALKAIEKYFRDGDEEKLAFNFDFWGIQYYFRTVSRFALFPPVLYARDVSPEKRNAEMNTMSLEPYPQGITKVLNQLRERYYCPDIMITESGVCFEDHVNGDIINDTKRKNYHIEVIKEVQKLSGQWDKLKGYFVWTLTDNFEWSEGYKPKFGIVHVDFNTQQRIIKESGHWFKEFLK